MLKVVTAHTSSLGSRSERCSRHLLPGKARSAMLYFLYVLPRCDAAMRVRPHRTILDVVPELLR
eukprot:6185815-Pleurochrysis_carterae.AAC.3